MMFLWTFWSLHILVAWTFCGVTEMSPVSLEKHFVCFEGEQIGLEWHEGEN